MGLKSKSVVIIIILAFVGILAFGTGAYLLTNSKSNRFASDGYILMAEAAGDADGSVTSSSVWFGAGKAYASGTAGVSFTDAQGNAVTVDEDSFVHYTDASVSSVKNTVVMDLDNYVQDYIQYYYLEQGSAIASDNGAYYIKAQEDAPSFSNFLIKSSDLHYLLGSPTMYFVRSSDVDETVITSGYVEITYLSDDYSIALVNDGSSAWQMLTENTYIQLENGVKFDLSTGALSYGASDSEEASTYYVGDIDVDVNLNVAVYSSTVYPTYRFTVINGADGADGEDGNYGDNGAEGTRGEQGETGAAGADAGEGTAGEAGGNGTAGVIAEEGSSGGLWDGVEVIGRVPVVQIREWSIAGSVLHFVAYMDEDSCDLIEEETSSILLEDLDDGTTMEWTERGDEFNQSVDFSEDNSDGFEFYYNQIVPGHSYRMTISAAYTINGVKNTQALLVRNFTADDYGVVFNRIASDNTSVSYSIELTNSNVTLNTSGTDVPVTITVNGNEYYPGFENWTTAELKEIVIKYDQLDKNDENINYAGQEMNIEFSVNVIVKSYDYVNKEYKMSSKKTLNFEDTVTVRKAQPTVGGVRLTAYNSGLFLAELLGEYNSFEGSYDEVDDVDAAITSIRFELYKTIRQEDGDTYATLDNLVETIEVTSGYIGYFPVTDTQDGSGISLGTNYYVKAYCMIDDGEMVSELPVKESREDSWSSEIGGVNYLHAGGAMAWDYAILNNITSTSISFVGNDGIYNTADSKQNPGITFNRISGSIYAVIAADSNYYISTDCPIEIQISASPDYYVSLKYDSIGRSYRETDSLNREVCEAKPMSGITEDAISAITPVNHSGNAIVVKLPIDLKGLKANTTYLVNMYGYENPTEQESPTRKDLDRVIMGSMAISTADTRNITVSLKEDTSITRNGGIGCILTLGEDGAQSLYDAENDTYDDNLYATSTDAAYRSLASITLDLYCENSTGTGADELVGTCVISDTKDVTGDNTEKNSIYEQFYGKSTKGLIGVGEKFKYQFRHPKTNKVLVASQMNGVYYIVVSAAYDYTEERYNNRSEANTAYDYYGWRAEKSQYVNNLVINGGVEEKVSNLEMTSIPFKLPSTLANDDGSYVTVEKIKNSDAYMCNFTDYETDTTAEKLYCSSWDADTVAGLKLTTNYEQLDTGTNGTKTFTFYGFTEEEYQSRNSTNSALIEKTDGSNEGNFFFSYSFSISENPTLVGNYSPEIWLMFYDPDVNKDIYNNIFDKTQSEYVGYAYARTIKNPDENANCKSIQIIYMDKNVFTRGQSYYFAYDAELSEYEWEKEENGNVTKQIGFHFPSDYYEYFEETGYNFANSLKSAKVSVDKQTPVIYSWLENTTEEPEDRWHVYISDPDNAIEWESLLNKKYSSTSGGIFGYKQSLDSSVVLSLTSSNEDGSTTISSDSVYEGSDAELPTDASKIVSKDQLNRFAEKLMQDGGGMLYVGGLPADGLIYNVYLNYKLQDKNGTEKLLRVISHNYMGQVTIQGQNDDTPSFRLELDDENADHDTMRIYLSAPDSVVENSDETPNETPDDTPDVTSGIVTQSYMDNYYLGMKYLSQMESIAAVRVRAKVKSSTEDNGDEWVYIKEQVLDSEGNYQTGTAVKDLWVVPNAPSAQTTGTDAENADEKGYTDYRYYLEFGLSDFNDTSNTQYSVGDQIRFEVEFYYATGESVAWTVGSDGNYTIKTQSGADSTSGYVVRYVDHATTPVQLYGSNQYRISGYYALAHEANASMGKSAAKSFYQIDGSMSTTYEKSGSSTQKQLEWSQSMKLISETFNLGYKAQVNATLRKNTQDNVSNEVSDAVEIIKTGTAVYDGEDLTTTVQSFVPQLENFTSTPGMTTVNITGTLKNGRLVEYPGSEKFHLYYLVYKVNGESEELVGAMVGDETIVNSGKLNVDFTLDQTGTPYCVRIYYKSNSQVDEATFKEQTDAEIFRESVTVDGANKTNTVKAGTFYTDSSMANLIATKVTSNNNVFLPVQGVSEHNHVTTKEGIAISSTSLTLNTATSEKDTSEAAGGSSAGTTAIEDGRTLQLTTSIKSEIVEKERPTLRIFYRLERIAQSNYTAVKAEDGTDSNDWEVVIADQREPEDDLAKLNWSGDAAYSDSAFDKAHFWQYYDEEPDKNGNGMTYAPDPDAISNENIMEMSYYTGGLITPGYYYRVTTRVYQMVGNEYINVTLGTDQYAASEPELWSAWSEIASSSKVWSQISYSESNAITVTFALYDKNDTSVDGRYFVRLAKLTDQGWEVVENDPGVDIANSDMNYAQAYYMNISYQNVKFTGLDAESTYRLQFYAAFDTDYDNHIDRTTDAVSGSYLTGNFTKSILSLNDYYPHKSASTVSAPQSLLTETDGAYMEAFEVRNPYNNTEKLKFADNRLLVGTSAQTSTVNEGLEAYVGSYISTSVNAGSNSIAVKYKSAFNTDQIDKITYDVVLTTSSKTVQYVSHDIYANDLLASYGSYYFTDKKGNSATSGTVILNLTLNTVEESETGEESSTPNPLNLSNPGEYTVILRFYRAKRDANNEIVKDAYGNPTYELMKMDGDLDPVFTVQ